VAVVVLEVLVFDQCRGCQRVSGLGDAQILQVRAMSSCL
jgi:hypothetical protein